MLSRLHDAFKNGSLLFSSLHVNGFGVGEQVVNWQTTSAWCFFEVNLSAISIQGQLSSNLFFIERIDFEPVL